MTKMFNYKDIVNDVTRQNDSLKTITSEESECLKQCLYEMAVDLDIICRKNDIYLFLVGGSLLGAVRHQGFIPWDDDMDMGLIRADYEKFKRIFDKEFSEKYELRSPNYHKANGNRFMQVYKKGTYLHRVGASNPLCPDMIYIDIFPYDYVPERVIYKAFKGMRANALMFIASCVMDEVHMGKEYRDFLHKSKKGKLFLNIREMTGKIFSFRSPEKWFDLVDNSIRYKKETCLLTSATGRRHYFHEIYGTEVFLPLTEILFRDHKFYAPGNWEIYLRGNYGDDYMTPPSDDQKESHTITEVNFS